MTGPVLAGAEPFSAPGGPNGVLVVHGFTGSPQSMRPLAEALAAAGHAVELPLLPGHGTSVADMGATGWQDWSGAAEAAYLELARRCERVVVAGLSMGGTLACWLAVNHPEIAGVVAVNPMVEPVAESFLDVIRGVMEAGETTAAGIGSDVADPDVTELAYDAIPLAPLLGLQAAVIELAGRLADIRCPLLLLSSRQDHVVPPSNADFLARSVSGPVERVSLERSYHVATIDYDRDEIARRATEFAAKVFGG